MAGSDQVLQSALTELAAKSKGRLKFAVTTVPAIGLELGVKLGHSPNPVYSFEVTPESGTAFRAVAFTLKQDGSGRGATRAEALGRAIAASGGRLFEFNPLLLVYDYTGNQFLAVSALALFDAFAREVATNPVAVAETATFSLTPNFANKTISLYAKAPDDSVWHASASAESLTLEQVYIGLARVRDETAAGKDKIPQIVSALKQRIEGKSANPDVPHVAAVPISEALDDDVRIPDRIWQMVLRAIRSSTAVILVGPPGTGKTALLRRAIRTIAAEPVFADLKANILDPIWATPDESWTSRELVGGDTIIDGDIKFQPGRILKAIEGDRWLILDEANRADMDRIFGGLLTWLSGGSVTLGNASTAPNAPSIELGWNASAKKSITEGVESGTLVGEAGKVRYLAGTAWRLLGTYNALDAQRVFRFGAALGRRFVRVPIPATEPALFAEALIKHATDLQAPTRKKIHHLYIAHYETPATQLGPAVFLSMCRYLRVAAIESSSPSALSDAPAPSDGPQSDPLDTNTLNQALAEAYVVNVGTMLAHLEERDRDELKTRVIAGGAFTDDEWAWISSMIQALA